MGVSEPDSVLLVESRDRIRVVRLNRPEALNAANPELHRRLAEVWLELEGDPGCSVVVITGNGRAFCGGGDMTLLKRMNEDEEVRAAILREARQIVERLIRFRFPVIAAVNGPAVGLGCSLAGLSDVVLIEESAYLADPHVSVGLVAADGGALTWPSMTSLLRAKEYLFTGDRIVAKDAVEFGLANRVVPDGSSLDEALSLAERIARQPTQALIDTKRALNKHLERAMHDVLDFALAAESISSASAPHRQIVDRFLEKSASTAAAGHSEGKRVVGSSIVGLSLEDRSEITDLLSQYGLLLDRQQVDEWMALFDARRRVRNGRPVAPDDDSRASGARPHGAVGNPPGRAACHPAERSDRHGRERADLHVPGRRNRADARGVVRGRVGEGRWHLALPASDDSFPRQAAKLRFRMRHGAGSRSGAPDGPNRLVQFRHRAR